LQRAFGSSPFWRGFLSSPRMWLPVSFLVFFIILIFLIEK
jgi:hypothetical protein